MFCLSGKDQIWKEKEGSFMLNTYGNNFLLSACGRPHPLATWVTWMIWLIFWNQGWFWCFLPGSALCYLHWQRHLVEIIKMTSVAFDVSLLKDCVLDELCSCFLLQQYVNHWIILVNISPRSIPLSLSIAKMVLARIINWNNIIHWSCIETAA